MTTTPNATRMALNAAMARTLRAAAFSVPVLVLGACAAATTTQDATTKGTDPGAPATASTASPPKPCDTSVNPSGYYRDAEVAGVIGMTGTGMDHSHSGPMDHGNPSTGGTVKPMDMSGGLGEVEASRVMVKLAKMSDAEYQEWLKSLNPNRSSGAPDDTGKGGHLGPQAWQPIVDTALCEKLQSELEVAKETAKKFPKASDATAAGYFRVAPYLPGIASHWMKFSLVDDEFDVTQPEMLLYDGNDANANLVGLSYYMRANGDVEPTDGFTGDNDHYHRHQGLCVGPRGVIGDSNTTAEDCKAIGGRKQDGASGWMSHAWVVEGCESPWGVFSAQNPILDMPLVDKSGQGAPCSGSEIVDKWDPAPADK